VQSDKYDKSKRFDKLKESKKIARKRPTINDVAQLANVSTATVSRCLSKPELVRPDVRTRVEASVVELGYVLDGAAKTLKTHQSKTIGVIVPTLEIGGYASAIQAFEKTVAAEK
jgi:LacI family transcriptional regulator